MSLPSQPVSLDKLVSLCKRRGFMYQSSEIYGGLASTWDYGPLGVELKRNVKEAWWKDNVLRRDDIVGLDAAILMHPKVWEASGHLDGFTDPLLECKSCNHRFRADHVWIIRSNSEPHSTLTKSVVANTHEEASQAVQENNPKLTSLSKMPHIFQLSDTEDLTSIPCPTCETIGSLTGPHLFNLMFKTFMGPIEDSANTIFLRPETAQGIFVNFVNVVNSTRKKLPFGIAQTGKVFRNEITTGNFFFRTREFEQMEIEYFVKPATDEEFHEIWTKARLQWYLNYGISSENLRLRKHDQQELAHYAKATTDIEYHFPWGWGELEGIANRTDFDLMRHTNMSGERLVVFDEETNMHISPYIIEPSGGVDRATLTFLLDSYCEEEIPTNSGKIETRTLLKLNPALAPVKAAVLPLSRNAAITPLALEIANRLRTNNVWNIEYDDSQSIGRRYRRFDEIGTPICITIDFETLNDHEVTIRDRDTMQQTRIPISNLENELQERLNYPPHSA